MSLIPCCREHLLMDCTRQDTSRFSGEQHGRLEYFEMQRRHPCSFRHRFHCTTHLRMMKQNNTIKLSHAAYFVRPRVEVRITWPCRLCLACTNKAKVKIASYHNCEIGKAVPAVVLSPKEPISSLRDLKEVLHLFEQTDDVYDASFLQDGLLLLQTAASPASAPAASIEVTNFLRSQSTTLLFLHPENAIPHGPYFAIGTQLHQAWRLRFIIEWLLISARFEAVNVASEDGLHKAVAVPSRLYAQVTGESTLSGMRLSIKDNMHIAGLITTLGSRSYTTCEGIQQETSEYVKLLMQKGAVVIGKTKLSAWAGSEVPANQCIDYFPPWNVRGDGYQGPSGSSSGAGASTAGSFDTVGLMSRKPQAIQRLLSAGSRRISTDLNGHQESIHTSKYPNRIIYPTDFFPLRDTGQQKMTQLFLANLESFLGVERTDMSFTELWRNTGPSKYRSRSPKEFLAKVRSDLNDRLRGLTEIAVVVLGQLIRSLSLLRYVQANVQEKIRLRAIHKSIA
nr:hypothetical protein CFP56_11589 [Quercus suber]